MFEVIPEVEDDQEVTLTTRARRPKSVDADLIPVQGDLLVVFNLGDHLEHCEG